MNSSISEIKGGLIWITGYSGAGKTTIARLVHEKLSEMNLVSILLDGDELRAILGEGFGHELYERRRLAYIYGRLCKKISDSGVVVVIATIAMFESVRKENRISNSRYLEVYLNVPLSVRSERDPKGLYKAAATKGTGNSENTFGLEEPESPDLVIRNYGGVLPKTVAEMIVSQFQTVIEQKIQQSQNENIIINSESTTSTSRTQYWDSYYKKRKAPISPSSFALFCHENYLNKNCHLLEFGCGNGRDSFYFSKYYRVIAIDESAVVVEANRIRASQESILNIEFIQGEYGTNIAELPAEVDAIYSRFVMHAMPEDAETRALNASWHLLRNHGYLLLEFRTTNDPLMGKGDKLSEMERKTDHYRRFIDFSIFCKKLVELGFVIEYAVEKQGLATFGSDDPVVGRIVARKVASQQTA